MKVGFVNTFYQRFVVTITFLITVPISVCATIELKVVRPSLNTLDVQLTKSEEVLGIQFCLCTSGGMVLGSVQPGALTMNPSWIVDSYSLNDSTVNVLILNTQRALIPRGSGTLISLGFTMAKPREVLSVIFTNVMVIDTKGDSLGTLTANYIWNTSIFSGVNADDSKLFVLGQNYPNPFNPATVLNYQLNSAGHVRLSIYDITGREVIRLVDQYQYVGQYNVKWDSSLKTGRTLASGMYIARLNVDEYSVSRKMLLTK